MAPIYGRVISMLVTAVFRVRPARDGKCITTPKARLYPLATAFVGAGGRFGHFPQSAPVPGPFSSRFLVMAQSAQYCVFRLGRLLHVTHLSCPQTSSRSHWFAFIGDCVTDVTSMFTFVYLQLSRFEVAATHLHSSHLGNNPSLLPFLDIHPFVQ